MSRWIGAAGVCVNKHGELLMVLQGKPHEEKSWSVPSGGMEEGETLEVCCSREVYEETGYRCNVLGKIREKEGAFGEGTFHVSYFEIEVVDGSPTIHDPDELIHDIAWHNQDILCELNLSFPEDRAFLIEYMTAKRGANYNVNETGS